MYEGGHRVPLIVSVVGPHGSHLLEAVAGGPGAAATATVGLVDLFATTRALLGEAADDDGRAFPAAGADRVIGSQSFDGSLVLIWGSQKAVFSSGSGGFSDPVGVPCAPDSTVGQFFDLGPDPRETANLWQASSQAVRAMASDFAGATRFEWTPTLPRRRERRIPLSTVTRPCAEPERGDSPGSRRRLPPPATARTAGPAPTART